MYIKIHEMKKIFIYILFTVALAACTQRICPTYAENSEYTATEQGSNC